MSEYAIFFGVAAAALVVVCATRAYVSMARLYAVRKRLGWVRVSVMLRGENDEWSGERNVPSPDLVLIATDDDGRKVTLAASNVFYSLARDAVRRLDREGREASQDALTERLFGGGA